MYKLFEDQKLNNDIFIDNSDRNYNVVINNFIDNIKNIFMIACKNNNHQIVKYILQHNVVPVLNYKDDIGNTPVHYIVSNWENNNDYNDIINMIFNRNDVHSFIDERGHNGDTLIIIATKKQFTPLCNILKNKRCSLNIKNDDGLYVGLDTISERETTINSLNDIINTEMSGILSHNSANDQRNEFMSFIQNLRGGSNIQRTTRKLLYISSNNRTGTKKQKNNLTEEIAGLLSRQAANYKKEIMNKLSNIFDKNTKLINKYMKLLLKSNKIHDGTELDKYQEIINLIKNIETKKELDEFLDIKSKKEKKKKGSNKEKKSKK